jgi:hypothetical protein
MEFKGTKGKWYFNREEPKQETVEEAAEKHSKKMWGVYFNDIHPDVSITQTQGEITIEDFIAGAKSNAARDYWFKIFQQEQDKNKYSEEEVLEHLNHLIMMPSSKLDKFTNDEEMVTMKWFNQFKK